MFSTLPVTSSKDAKVHHLKQKAKVIWLTGLSGSGKTTLANKVEQILFEQGYFCTVLDGDALRQGINSNLAFDTADRFENARRVAEIAKLFLRNGIVTIVATISPHKEMRRKAREIIGNDDFIEVFINAPLEVCEKRDPKGLYQKARQGFIKDFTGIGDVYEPPDDGQVYEIQTDSITLEKSVDKLYSFILPHILFSETK